MSPIKAQDWINDVLSAEEQFPLGVKKDAEDLNPGEAVSLGKEAC